MFSDKFTKVQQWILIISFVVFVIICAIFVYELIDLHNDYVCSTTNNVEWFNTHNCIKYFND